MAEIADRIVKNSIIIFIFEVLVRFLVVFFNIFAARKLGVVEFGNYSVAINFVVICGVLYDGGLKSLVIRDVARYRQDAHRYYHNLLTVKIFLGILGYLIIILASISLKYTDSLTLLISLIAIQYFLSSIDDFHMAFFNAFELRKYEAYLKLIQKSFFVAIGFTVLSINKNLNLFILCVIGSGILTNLIGFLLMKKYIIRPRLSSNFEFIRSQLSESWPFALSSVAIGLYFYVDSIILSKLSTPDSVGYYNSAYRILEGTLIIPFAIMGSINPVLSRLFLESLDKMKRMYHFSLKIMFAIGLPIAICGTILAKKIILFLYGANYEPATASLTILVWAVLVIFMNTVVSSTLNALNRQRTWLLILSIAAVFNVISNIIFIPRYDLLAASTITFLTEFFVFLAILLQLKKIIGPSKIFTESRRIILGAIITGVFVLVIQDLHILIIIGLTFIIYPIITILIKGWNQFEVELLLETISSRISESTKNRLKYWTSLLKV
jgi:O-antigen/teichoic acid export membrane protein